MKNFVYSLIVLFIMVVSGCSTMDTTSVVRVGGAMPNNNGKFGTNDPCTYEVYRIVGKPAWQVVFLFERPVKEFNFGPDTRSVTTPLYAASRLEMPHQTHADKLQAFVFEVLALSDAEPSMAEYVVHFEAEQKDAVLSSVRGSSDENEFRFTLTRDGLFSQGDFAALYQLQLRAPLSQPAAPATVAQPASVAFTAPASAQTQVMTPPPPVAPATQTTSADQPLVIPPANGLLVPTSASVTTGTTVTRTETPTGGPVTSTSRSTTPPTQTPPPASPVTLGQARSDAGTASPAAYLVLNR